MQAMKLSKYIFFYKNVGTNNLNYKLSAEMYFIINK